MTLPRMVVTRVLPAKTLPFTGTSAMRAKSVSNPKIPPETDAIETPSVVGRVVSDSPYDFPTNGVNTVSARARAGQTRTAPNTTAAAAAATARAPRLRCACATVDSSTCPPAGNRASVPVASRAARRPPRRTHHRDWLRSRQTRRRRYNPVMPILPKPVATTAPVTAASRVSPAPPRPPRSAPERDDAVICERCGAEMFRMHAVWRCPACRYKTDCCGW